MESSVLSEVDDTSILSTGLPTPLCLSSQLATGLSPLAPRSGLERSDFVLWHRSDAARGAERFRSAPVDQTWFRGGEGVIDLNAEVAHRALDLLVPNKSCTARRLPVRR